ncbi:MAG: RluA family pseudouridine synthase [Candidatus Peregrinibacteria bacterium]|nr:RluA family pseudouridine synthase [Candidatus Peregrinibacteria bacterium]
MPIHPGRILYEDPHLLVVSKLPRELAVRGSGRVDKLPLLDFLRKDYPGIRPIHRLDFETSGVLLFARSKAVLETVIEGRFKGWVKTYHAIILGSPPKNEGAIHFPLPARKIHGRDPGGQEEKVEAHTRYRILARFRDATYVEAKMETGRHHQIRRHFAMLRCPLALDDVYGDAKKNKRFTTAYRYSSFFLHAISVTFPHPVTGKEMRIEAPLPAAFEDVLEKLRGKG